MIAPPRRVAAALSAAVMLLSLDALADKVATLHARGSAPTGERANIRSASDGGARSLGHETVGENDVLQGESAAGDKIGSSEGMIAVGKTTGADWVVEPSVSSSDSGTRVELKVCQVSSGRVETLARDLDPKGDPLVQMREMLALLLRPQGVGDDPLPWEAKKPAVVKPPDAVLPKKKEEPKPEPAPAVVWGSKGTVSFGVAGHFGTLLARPSDASGSRTLYGWSLHANFALPDRPWFEIVARVGGLYGPGNALEGDLGARVLARSIGSSRLALGAGATFGVFGAFGSGLVRPAFGLEPTASFAITPMVQAELIVPLRLAPGSGGTLVWTGGTLALLARF